jgi:hypothetical protein
METICFSETSVNYQWTTYTLIPVDIRNVIEERYLLWLRQGPFARLDGHFVHCGSQAEYGLCSAPSWFFCLLYLPPLIIRTCVFWSIRVHSVELFTGRAPISCMRSLFVILLLCLHTRKQEWLRLYATKLAALGPGVHSASKRNEYQKQKNHDSGT